MLLLLLCLFVFLAIGILAVPVLAARNLSLVSSWALASLFLTCVSISLYYVTANTQGLRFWQQEGRKHYLLLQQVNNLGGMAQIIREVERRVHENPEDAKGWLVLGKIYLSQEQKAAALKALQNARKLEPNNPEIDKYYQLAHKP